jgi:hypothetical protein
VAPLQQHRRRALRGGELDLGENLVDRERPRLRIAGLPVERAELAVGDADVGVVRVRVDDEGDDLPGEPGVPNFLGEGAELEQWRVGQEEAAFLAVEALAVQDLVSDLGDQFQTCTTL